MLLAKSTGGIGTHVDELTAELRALGHDVVIVTDALTAATFGWPEARRLWPSSGATLPRATAALRAQALGVDVVHAHGHQAAAWAALALRTMRRGDRPALVVSLHNAVLGGRRRQVVGAATALAFARTAQLVTGASSDLVDQARSWGARWSELAAVPSPRVPALLAQDVLSATDRRALAHDLLAASGVDYPDGADLVLTVARIAPQKDLSTLVAAASVPRAPSARARVWVVIGGGDADLADRLRAEARHRSAPVHLLGPQSDPGPWLRAARVFVLTSQWEARALVVQESMAAGTPVVARDTGGLHDLVSGVGSLVDGSDPRRWAAAVDTLCDDDVAWQRAATSGRARASSWDDGPRTATRWVAWYAQARAMT